MTEVHLLLFQLHDAMKMFKLPVKLVTGQNYEFRARLLYGQINHWISTAQALMNTKFNIVSANVINLRAQDALPQVEISLRVLTDIISIVNKDLLLAKQISSKDLTEEEADALIEKVGELIVNTSARVEML